ncbi:MAG: peptidylprolyl isomerase [Pseudomonadota bacterium]|nr:peptidylprolyl isomerase [Pseudomonadota bacterium]
MTDTVAKVLEAPETPLVRDDILATVRGAAIRRSDVFSLLKLKGAVRGTILELIELEVVRIRAVDHGIAPDETELARHIERRRAIAGLSDPVRFQTWLRQNGVSYEQWNAVAKVALLREILAAKVIDEDAILARYTADADSYRSVTIGRIAACSHDDINRVRDLLDQGQDFVTIARNHSVDASTRPFGGYVGAVRPGMLTVEVEEAAFASQGGDIIGPFLERDRWTIYKVYTINVSALTDSLKSIIREQIFNEWLRREIETVPA